METESNEKVLKSYISDFVELHLGDLALIKNVINSIDYNKCSYTKAELDDVYECIKKYRKYKGIYKIKCKKREEFLNELTLSIGGICYWIFSIFILPSLNWSINWESKFSDLTSKITTDPIGVIFLIPLLPVILILAIGFIFLPAIIPMIITMLLLSLIDDHTMPEFRMQEPQFDKNLCLFLSEEIRNTNISFKQQEYYTQKKHYFHEDETTPELILIRCGLYLIMVIIMLMNITSVSYTFHEFASWALISLFSFTTICLIINKNVIFTWTVGAAIMYIPGLVHIDSSLWTLFDIIIGFGCIKLSLLDLGNFDILLHYRKNKKCYAISGEAIKEFGPGW